MGHFQSGRPLGSSFQLRDVRSSPAGERYLRVDADGVASFGADGRTPARVHALYDPRNGEWLQLAYELGGEDASS